MKAFSRSCVTVFLAAIPGLVCASAADMSDIKTVYLLPMASGLDQFLAIRLTNDAVFQVVTDPQRADAILTDRIGAAFEQRLDELYNVKSKPEEQENGFGDNARPTMQPLTRGKGAIFLVDRKTKNVVWSTYALSNNSTPDAMNHLADRIVSRLEKDRKGKKSAQGAAAHDNL